MTFQPAVTRVATASAAANQRRARTADTYSLSETVAGTAGFSLTETGSDDTTLTESGNHVLATYHQDVVGSDTASFIEAGSNSGGSYSETLLVNETASWTQTGNSAQQTFSKTETGKGDYIRTDTGPGATLGSLDSIGGYSYNLFDRERQLARGQRQPERLGWGYQHLVWRWR